MSYVLVNVETGLAVAELDDDFSFFAGDPAVESYLAQVPERLPLRERGDAGEERVVEVTRADREDFAVALYEHLMMAGSNLSLELKPEN